MKLFSQILYCVNQIDVHKIRIFINWKVFLKLTEILKFLEEKIGPINFIIDKPCPDNDHVCNFLPGFNC